MKFANQVKDLTLHTLVQIYHCRIAKVDVNEDKIDEMNK